MSIIISRTCTEISAGNEDQHQEKESRPLEAFRDVPVYVLLGDPGAGKTTAFESECEALGEKACLIIARDFLTCDPQSHPEWRDKTLFIDGLDEIRVGANDARTPFDQIRGHLDELGKPRFRLSCREADWLRANDQKHLESVSPDSKVTLLDAAGRLCAVQLISGTAGFTLRGQADEGYPDLDQYGYDSLEMLRHALATKLFRGVSNNRFAPVHRHIAEFLGARHLTTVIKNELPAQRVVSLIAGKDGIVVTEMSR